MAGASKTAFFFLALSASLVKTWGERGLEGADDFSPLTSELERLRAKIDAFEMSLAKRTRELNSGDDAILQLKDSITEMSATLASLITEFGSLEKRSSFDFHSAEIMIQITKLYDQIKVKVQKKDDLKTGVVEAETKVEELNLALHSLLRTSDEQRSRIQRLVLAIEESERELMKSHKEKLSKAKEKMEGHLSWLSHWLSVHVDHCQDFLAFYWNYLIRLGL